MKVTENIHKVGDDMVGVDYLPLDDRHVAAMGQLRYEFRGEAGISGRMFFRKRRDDGMTTHHVHVAAVGNEFCRDHFRFRDYLRSHPDEAARYGQVKRDLAELYRTDRHAYTSAESPIILEMIESARLERKA